MLMNAGSKQKKLSHNIDW